MTTNRKWAPRPGWVLVQRTETEDRIGSLYLTETSRARLVGWTYEVVVSGAPLPPDVDADPTTPHPLEPGDWILTPPRRAMDYDEEGLLLLAETDVWAVLR